MLTKKLNPIFLLKLSIVPFGLFLFYTNDNIRFNDLATDKYPIFTEIAFFLLLMACVYFFSILIKKKNTFSCTEAKIFDRDILIALNENYKINKHKAILMDLENLDEIEKKYGNSISTKALKFAAIRIKKYLKKDDYILKYDKNKFLIILNSEREEKDIKAVVNHLCQSINVSLEKNKHFINVSAGISKLIGSYDGRIQDAIQDSEISLYYAKKNKNSNIVFIYDIKKRNNAFENQQHSFSYIKSLIDSGFVFCHFQPIFSNNSCELVKYESLVRLKTKEGKILYPSEFLGTIWNTEEYTKLTKQVIIKTIEIFKNRKENFSINLNMHDMLNDEIILLLETIERTNPGIMKRLGVEILEYDDFKDMKKLKSSIERLKKLKIKIILDDFGSGQANFHILEKLEIDELKIDGGLVKNVNKSEKSKFLLDAIATFATNSNITTTVEFVSSREIYTTIAAMNFDQLQGFYLGEPSAELKCRRLC